MTRRIEMIEEYVIQQSDGTDYNPLSYIWTDNKGQLVRCKDCKWYQTNYSWNGKEHKVCANDESIRHDDDFCSFAERKEDDMRGGNQWRSVEHAALA